MHELTDLNLDAMRAEIDYRLALTTRDDRILAQAPARRTRRHRKTTHRRVGR